MAIEWLPYRNRSGRSGVTRYAAGPGWIRVRFGEDRKSYLYDGRAPGADKVRRMQRLAGEGLGLATYIARHVRDDYAAIEPL